MNCSFAVAELVDRQECNIRSRSSKVFECWKMHELFYWYKHRLLFDGWRLIPQHKQEGVISGRRWGSCLLSLGFIYNALTTECVGESVSVCEQVIYKNLSASGNLNKKRQAPENRIFWGIHITSYTVIVTEKKKKKILSSSHNSPSNTVESCQQIQQIPGF